MAELDDAMYSEITRLCEEGNVLDEAGDHAGAIACFSEAWNLLPEPKFQWEAASWLLVSIGDVSFQRGKYEDAKNALQTCLLECDGMIGNPFVHFRLGQSCFELSEFDRAADELMRAYMGAGEEIFSQHDPKYRDFLASRANLDTN